MYAPGLLQSVEKPDEINVTCPKSQVYCIPGDFFITLYVCNTEAILPAADH